LNPAGITNGANHSVGSLAPGELIAILGLRFGPGALALAQPSGGLYPRALAQTRVLFDGAPAPLISVSGNLIWAIVPYAVAGRSQTRIQVEYQGRAGNAVIIPVTAAAPALITADASGRGQGAILNQNASINSAANPATRGSVIQLYGTGEGVTSPPGVDGKIADAILPRPVLPVQVTIGGRNAEVQYAGAAPFNITGVFQINAVIPPDCPTGAVPVSVTVGGASSPDIATVAVQ
jgi:uncharacterized protein (TIGR03437 family)